MYLKILGKILYHWENGKNAPLVAREPTEPAIQSEELPSNITWCHADFRFANMLALAYSRKESEL